MIFMMESEMVGQELSQMLPGTKPPNEVFWTPCGQHNEFVLLEVSRAEFIELIKIYQDTQRGFLGVPRYFFVNETTAHIEIFPLPYYAGKVSGIVTHEGKRHCFEVLLFGHGKLDDGAPQNPALPNHEDLPMPPVNEDFSECFMTSWLAHQAEEAAKPAPLAAYPGAWPPPKHRFPGL